MHPRTEGKVKEYERWIEGLKELDSLQLTIDEFYTKIGKESNVMTYFTVIYIYIDVESVKEIAPILTTAIRFFGKILRRNVMPEIKNFEFYFDRIQMHFILKGDSCILVPDGEEVIEAKKITKYKLVCGGEKINTDDIIDININEEKEN